MRLPDNASTPAPPPETQAVRRVRLNLGSEVLRAGKGRKKLAEHKFTTQVCIPPQEIEAS